MNEQLLYGFNLANMSYYPSSSTEVVGPWNSLLSHLTPHQMNTKLKERVSKEDFLSEETNPHL